MKDKTLLQLQGDLAGLKLQVDSRSEKPLSKPKTRYEHAIVQATKRNKLWDISEQDYKSFMKLPCAYCSGKLASHGIGLDRILNYRHYTLDNVVPCCGQCNLIRGRTLTYEEMLVLGPHLRAIYDARNPRSTDSSNPSK